MSEAQVRAAVEAGLTESGLPGVVVAAATPQGGPLTLAVGARGLDDPTPLAPDAMFWVASMTKAVTSVVALQAVAEGRVTLDEPVARLAPELASPQVLEGFAEDGAPRLRPAKGAVTLRHLLTHTSGLGYDFASPPMARWVVQTGAQMLGPHPPAGLPLVFDPGESWAYGYSTDFAARVTEAATGKSLPELAAERIFRPLGMADATFAPSAEQSGRAAPMHMRGADGALVQRPFAAPAGPSFQMGGGGLSATAGDYLKFLQALLRRDERLLPAELMDLLLTCQTTIGRPGALASAIPQLAGSYDAFPDQPTGWSLGFLVNLEPGPNGRSAGSLGWAGLTNCYYWLDPQQGVAGLMLAQLLPFADKGALDLFARFEQAVYGR